MIDSYLIVSIIILFLTIHDTSKIPFYTLSKAWSGVNWTDLMAAQGAFGTDFYRHDALDGV